jgi:hypothetical protein
MPDALGSTIIPLNQGFATDLPPQERQITHLRLAENVIYDVSGVARKLGGAAAINSVAISGSPDVTGMFDYWLGGTSGEFTQKFVVMTSDGKIYKEDMDGTFDDITGTATLTANAIPVFTQAMDLLTIFTDANDTPLKWNQTGNVAALGGTPPVGRGMVFHVNRGWIWGTKANPSRISYSAITDVETWSGGDSGSIDIDPEDGDWIIGAASYKQVLLVFKGPNKGSIHQITGTAPANFARNKLVTGIPLQTHNSIVSVGDDIWFMSDRGIHSVAATERFGNFTGADLTRFNRTFFRDSINRKRLQLAWGVNYAHRSTVVWTLTKKGSGTNDLMFGLSYVRNAEEGLKALVWNRQAQSAAIRINPVTKVRELVTGRTGSVLRQDLPDKNIETSTAYTLRQVTPHLEIGTADATGRPRPDQPVTLNRLFLRSRPTGDWNVSIDLTRDNAQTETYTFNQAKSGFTLGTSLLGTGKLGGGHEQIVYSTPSVSGEARTVRLDITQGGLNQGADLVECGLEWTPAAQSDNPTL